MTGIQEHWNLLLRGSSVQWVSVDWDYRVSYAMVFIVEVDVALVFLADGNVCHAILPLLFFTLAIVSLCLPQGGRCRVVRSVALPRGDTG